MARLGALVHPKNNTKGKDIMKRLTLVALATLILMATPSFAGNEKTSCRKDAAKVCAKQKEACCPDGPSCKKADHCCVKASCEKKDAKKS